MKYRKRPVVIDAFMWTGSNADELIAWADSVAMDPGTYAKIEIRKTEVVIPTLEGTMLASPGDWLICGVAGEVYPCKAEIFTLTYEAA